MQVGRPAGSDVCPRVLSPEALRPLDLVAHGPAKLRVPGTAGPPGSNRQRRVRESRISTWRRMATTSSGWCLFLAVMVLLRPKAAHEADHFSGGQITPSHTIFDGHLTAAQ